MCIPSFGRYILTCCYMMNCKRECISSFHSWFSWILLTEDFLQGVYNIYRNTKPKGQIFANNLARSNKTLIKLISQLLPYASQYGATIHKNYCIHNTKLQTNTNCVPVHGTGLELDGLQGLFQPRPFYGSVILRNSNKTKMMHAGVNTT